MGMIENFNPSTSTWNKTISLLHTHTSVVEEEFSSQGKWFFRVISMPWTLERVALRNTPTVAAENGPMFILP
jgi:hypothetical protein